MKKLFTIVILPLCAIFLVYLIYTSIMKPVNFNDEKAQREQVAIQRLTDIRTLQVAFKSVNNRFSSSVDSLIQFYNTGELTIVKQIGSMDDSLAVARKQVKREEIKVPVKDTLFKDRPDLVLDSLRYIPFTNKMPIEINTVVKQVSGIPVPLFEAKVPYGVRPAAVDGVKQPFVGLLQGMDEQLIINLNAEREDQGRFSGLMVGSIDNPNNNAGNWE